MNSQNETMFFIHKLNAHDNSKFHINQSQIQNVYDTLLQKQTQNQPLYEYLQPEQNWVKPYFDIDTVTQNKIETKQIQNIVEQYKNTIQNTFDIQNKNDIFVVGGNRPIQKQNDRKWKFSLHITIDNHIIHKNTLVKYKNSLKNAGFDPSVYKNTLQKFRMIAASKDDDPHGLSKLFPYQNDGTFLDTITLDDLKKSCIQYFHPSFKPIHQLNLHYLNQNSTSNNTPDNFPDSTPDNTQNLKKSISDENIQNEKFKKLNEAQMKTLLSKLNQKYADNYEDWIKVGSALKYEGFSIDLFDSFSQRSSNYGNVQKTWKSLNRNGECKMGTLMLFLKNSDRDHFDYVLNQSKLENETGMSAFTSVSQYSNKTDHWREAIRITAQVCNEQNYAFDEDTIYHKKHLMFYEPIPKDSHVKSYIEDFIKNTLFPQSRSPSIDWVLARPHKISELAKTTSVSHFGFKQFKYNRNIVAFSNGFLNVLQWTFTPYNDGYPENTYAKAFFNTEFKPQYLNEPWKNIPTPTYDTIWKTQIKDEDALLVAYGLLGQLHFPMDDNNFQVAPYIKGTPNSGKSTVVDPIRSMFPNKKIGNFDHKQKVFGMASLIGKFVCIDNDTPHDMVTSIGKTEFQKLISGEHNVVPIKNALSWEGVLDCHTLMCSNYMQDVKEAGEIQRRLAVFLFSPVEGKNSSYPNLIKKEIPYIFIKTILAYREMKIKYQNIPFDEWGIDYFVSQKEEALFNNNPIYKFIDENNGFKIRDGSKTRWSDFETAFKIKNKFYKLKTTDQSFTRLGLEVKRINTCSYCYNIHLKGCCEKYQREHKNKQRYIINLEMTNK